MSSGNLLEKVKQLRKITGVGYKDCKNAIDETQGDIEKSVELLRKKGIAKAIKKMSRVAAEGLICIYEQDNQFSMIEINSETDFVAKNNQFVNFAEEISQLALIKSGKMEDILNSTMTNKKNVKDNLVDLISKIGEKITLRRSAFIGKDKSINFSYTHSSLKKNVGKLGVLLSIETTKPKNEILNLGKQLAMQVAASSPLAIDKESLDQNILQKEKEIIKEELKNSGKDTKIVEKIAIGKLNKFIADNTLLNQEWIMDPKKKVKDVLKEVVGKDKIEIKKFIRFKVGEGV
ncbi:MAG: translation elongation factor Ts [Pelagibacteraceae bacterium]|jgi:elongation factor Ts|nr:MAG: translation elongation factor Ts [Pelagibacteraceae bacterium]RUA15682.1 MAG: translation elongation factor Ts [Alphaproteobacteria bacterium]